jgi:hypothetical protein
MADNSLNPPSSAKSTLTEAPLESWKEIATYLERDVSTVRRWEKHEELPVHRCLHQARSSVYAYPTELDAGRARGSHDRMWFPWRRGNAPPPRWDSR